MTGKDFKLITDAINQIYSENEHPSRYHTARTFANILHQTHIRFDEEKFMVAAMPKGYYPKDTHPLV